MPREILLGVTDIRRCEISALKVREEARRRIANRKVDKIEWEAPGSVELKKPKNIEMSVEENSSVIEIKGMSKDWLLDEMDTDIDFDTCPKPMPILPEQKLTIADIQDLSQKQLGTTTCPLHRKQVSIQSSELNNMIRNQNDQATSINVSISRISDFLTAEKISDQIDDSKLGTNSSSTSERFGDE